MKEQMKKQNIQKLTDEQLARSIGYHELTSVVICLALFLVGCLATANAAPESNEGVLVYEKLRQDQKVVQQSRVELRKSTADPRTKEASKNVYSSYKAADSGDMEAAALAYEQAMKAGHTPEFFLEKKGKLESLLNRTIGSVVGMMEINKRLSNMPSNESPNGNMQRLMSVLGDSELSSIYDELEEDNQKRNDLIRRYPQLGLPLHSSGAEIPGEAVEASIVSGLKAVRDIKREINKAENSHAWMEAFPYILESKVEHQEQDSGTDSDGLF